MRYEGSDKADNQPLEQESVAVSNNVKFELGHLSIFHMLIKSALPGYSFGSEIVLIFGIMSEEPSLAVVMLVFRLLHIVAIMFLMVIIFGTASTRGYLSKFDSKFLRRAALWPEQFHYTFAKSNIPLTGIVLILCACDISMVQMLPWKCSSFYASSKGFPNKSLMRFALGTDMVQGLVSALCSMIYISSAVARGAKNPTTSKYAQTFFGLSVTISLLTVTASFVILCLKERLLKRLNKKDEYEGGEKRKSATVEMGRIY